MPQPIRSSSETKVGIFRPAVAFLRARSMGAGPQESTTSGFTSSISAMNACTEVP